MSEPGFRDTDAPFSPEEAEQIRAQLAHPGGRLECPRCHRALESGPPVAAGGSILGVYLVRCPECRRAYMASEYRPA
jgi:hypothetical protein